MSLSDRLQHAWNAFRNPIGPTPDDFTYGGYYTRPDRVRIRPGNERSIINAVFNRIAIDVAAIPINHVRLDEEGRYKETIDSSLNRCFTLHANADQTGRAFFQDVVMSLCDEGCVAIVPVDTSLNPKNTTSYDIESLRVGKIKEWYPDKIKVELYNEQAGQKQDVIIPKSMAAIVENPLYSIMNEPSSTLRRLIRKLNILDAIDEQSGSGKLDVIIQLPYQVKGELKRAQAETRRKDVEMQLAGSKYGIAYIDGTEKVTQLNRPAENNLMSQIEYLTSMLYGQLGITEDVMNGTADERTMLNYNNRTIEPFLSAIVDAMKWKFLTQTARTQGQSIMFFRDPFRLIPMEELARIADTFTRNEILSPNEVRQIIGRKPDKDPKSDELRNRNLNQSVDEIQSEQPKEKEEDA